MTSAPLRPAAQPPCDVIVIGGGAAGLMAAVRAARRGARTVLLEKNRRPGVKILASGGGRCNLTTTRTGAALEASFPASQRRFLAPSLRAFPPSLLLKWFAERGVSTRVEAFEKIFPTAGRASVVLEALVGAVKEAGVRLVPGAGAQAVSRTNGGGFRVETVAGAFEARRVILAVGGRSYPRAGTTGDGYRIAQALGHHVTRQHPALVGLVIEDAGLRELAGIAVEQASVRLIRGGKRVLGYDLPLLFTHRGISGPGPMNLAGEIEAQGPGELEADLLPDLSFAEVESALLDRARRHPRRSASGLLPEQLPERLRDYVVTKAAVPAERVGSSLTKSERRRLVHALKGLRWPVSETLGFERAEVTRGGVALDEIDPKTLESRIVPGFHVCGEVLDIDGPIGGFNFQAAFATGWQAGEAAGC